MTLQRTLYTARWLATPDSEPIEEAALLVDERGIVERIAPAAAFDFSVDAARVDFGMAAILPGLVNVHAHPELSVFRGLLDDLPFHQWIPTLMRCKRDGDLTPEDYEAAAQWTCVELLRAGVTAVGATEDSGAAVKALNTAGMRGVVYLETFGPAPQQVEQSMSDLQQKVERHASLANARVRLGVSPHAPYTVSDALFTRVAEYARAEQLPVAIHAAEAEAEDLLVREALGPFAAGLRSRGIDVRARGDSTIDLLARTGILDNAPMLIHAVRVSDSDLHAIANAGASIAHCPVANARLGHGVAPIVEALEAGIAVAIGTDSVASNNRLDILEEARIAQIAQRARLQSAGALPAKQLLELTTSAGARILGTGSGTLADGESADFCVVRLDQPNAVPTPEPFNAVFHAARGSDVVFTAVEGRALYQDGVVKNFNEGELAERVQEIAARLRAVRFGA